MTDSLDEKLDEILTEALYSQDEVYIRKAKAETALETLILQREAEALIGFCNELLVQNIQGGVFNDAHGCMLAHINHTKAELERRHDE